MLDGNNILLATMISAHRLHLHTLRFDMRTRSDEHTFEPFTAAACKYQLRENVYRNGGRLEIRTQSTKIANKIVRAARKYT